MQTRSSQAVSQLTHPTRHGGGRRARVRGLVRVTQDFKLLAAAVNLARLASLGLRSTASGWPLQPA
jgi:IS5 family transposase